MKAEINLKDEFDKILFITVIRATGDYQRANFNGHALDAMREAMKQAYNLGCKKRKPIINPPPLTGHEKRERIMKNAVMLTEKIYLKKEHPYSRVEVCTLNHLDNEIIQGELTQGDLIDLLKWVTAKLDNGKSS
jgi:hypothetical protein